MNGGKQYSSTVRNTLRSLCCSNGWCYGIFWGFDHRNSLLLTLKDAYYEEEIGSLMDSMLLQAHVLGGGVIDQAAFSRNHRWMCLDSIRKTGSGSSQRLEEGFEDGSDFHYQSSMGIKTIAVISVEPWGVVQLGSTQEILESSGFADRVKLAFHEMIEGCKLEMLDDIPSHSDAHFFNLGAQFGSLLSSDVPPSADSDCFMEASYLPCIPSQSFPPNNFDHQLLEETFSSFDPSIWPLGLPQNETLLLTLDEMFQETADLCKPCPMNDASPLFCPSNNATGLIPLSKLSGDSSPVNITEYHQTNSMQSSVTGNKLYGFDPSLNDLGGGHGCNKPILFDANVSEKNIGSKVGTSSSLFSRLGLYQLLDGSTCSSSSLAKSDGSSNAAKRRKIDNYACSQSSIVRHGVELKADEICNKELESCVDESTGAGNSSLSMKQTETAKTGKKKAKAGPRPRPKDRQMIQDRLTELRGLIPNGEKMSIDRLLERTIRHLNFMNSLVKHSEYVNQANETRSEAVRKDHAVADGGVTWACELGSGSMVCPLIIEDLNTPGQMVIEILYDETGFFSEIVEVIRGFGLTILKGVMEVRDTKIWARFIVEVKGNRHGIRHEIFSCLMQRLQMSGGNQSNAGKHIAMPLFSNCQSAVPFPVDTIQCANL